ncbi:MAG: adenylate/guanylate cyclase domain-containing protein [Chromatiales bacterium]|nr:adenylate/guanylate cyclase domain-containing protein [Chromatiales bacterium]
MRRRLVDLARRPLIGALLIGHAVFLCVAALRLAGGLEFLELAAYDRALAWRATEVAPPATTLVAVTEEDIRRFGWPLTDERLAEVLARLLAHQPSVLGLDVYRDLPIAPGTEALDQLLATDARIVAVTKFGDARSGGVPPPRALVDTDRAAVNDFPVDDDGSVRRGLLFVDDGTRSWMSFGLRLALDHLAREGIGARPDPEHPEWMRVGVATMSPLEPHHGGYAAVDAGGYQFLLDFANAGAPFPRFTLSAVMDGALPRDAIAGHIVLLGVVAESAKDIFFVPVSPERGGSRLVSGVGLHAMVADQIVRMARGASPVPRPLGSGLSVAYLYLCTLVGTLVSYRVRRGALLLARFALMVSLLAAATYVGLGAGWWVPFAAPALGWAGAAALVMAHAALRERADRATLMQIFSRHVSGDVANALWQQRDQFLEGGRPRSQRLDATVLFTDLRGFTTVSERLDPQSLMDWLNEYMEAMANQVSAHHGIVDKYIGDAVMAVFGVPLARTSEAETRADARNAIECALGMERELARLNAHWRAAGLPEARMRVGIFTGPLVAGSLGSANRLNYTVIGDTVNTASRLESYDKSVGAEHDCRILVGEPSLDGIAEDFDARPVGDVVLRGKDQPVRVYLIAGRRSRTSQAAGDNVPHRTEDKAVPG